MNVFMDKFQNGLMFVANKLNNNKHLTALKDGMIMTIPLTIIGGVFILLAQPPINGNAVAGTNFFIDLLLVWKEWATSNSSWLLAVYHLTIGAIAIYVAFAVAYRLAKTYKLNGLAIGFASMFLFILTAAQPVATAELGTFIPLGNLGGKGMFYSIIVAFVTVDVFRYFKSKNITIKLPEQVPPNVAAPFEALIPFASLTIVFVVANLISNSFAGTDLCGLIYAILQPLMYASTSLPSVILISILLSLFWFVGIHGNNLVGAVLTPITTANIALNADVIISGHGTMTPLAGSFITIFGNWMSYPAMMIAFFLVAKSAHLKSIRKLAIIPDMFNINEPLTFGVPIVLNLTLALPIMICNVVMCSAAYIIMSSGIVGSIYVAVPWTTPGVINLFLSTGDFKSVIMWAVMFVVDIIILIPFVRIYDKQMLAEENANIGETAEA